MAALLYMRTIHRHLMSIADSEIREKALANVSKHKDGVTLNQVQTTLADAIGSAFVWGITPEGWKYWNQIRIDAKRGQLAIRDNIPFDGDVISLVEAELEQQYTEKGYTPYHDDKHTNGELALAGAAYALPHGTHDAECKTISRQYDVWPFGAESFNPNPDDRVRELVKACALLVREIERLQRIPK